MNGIEIRKLYHYGGDTIKIGFIGPGKAGVSIGRYFTHKGIKLTGFYGKTIEHTQEAANITNSKVYTNLEDLIKESELIFITTPDDTISIIDKELSKFNLQNKSIAHISGACSSTILNNAKQSGALIYSIHPIFAFSNKSTSIEDLEKIYFSIEGESLTSEYLNNKSEGLEIEDKKIQEELISNLPVIKLMNSIGNKFFIRQEKDSAAYHLANVFVSNLTLSLLESGTSYLRAMGLNETESVEALMPLITGNIKNIAENGFIKSLTGPVTRGDKGTILKHLTAIKEEDKQVYKTLSLKLLNLTAAKKNEDLESLCTNNSNYEETLQILRRM